MRIFNGIPAGDAYETIKAAFIVIERKAQEQRLTLSPWSLVELQPDNDDFAWLCDWARQLHSGVTRRCLVEQPWRTFGVEEKDFSYAVGIGTLLLILAVEVARREENERSLWATVEKSDFSETTKQILFIQGGDPTRAHRDAIELAARRLNLRHVFGIKGRQSWFDTIYLQIGFAKHGFMRRLPEWLVGQGWTQSIQQLLSGPMNSPTFQALWEVLRNFRREYIKEEEVRSLLRNNPWILPEWTDDLVQKACAERHLGLGYERDSQNVSVEATPEHFLDEPTLHWDPPNPPQFTCRIADLTKLELSENAYDVFIAGRRCGRLQKKSDGSYKALPADKIQLPITAPLLVANLVDPNGQVIQSQPLQLWDENGDVTAFYASSGHCLDPWKNVMRPETAYILLLAPDLTAEPQPTHWHMLSHQAAKLFFLPRGWSPQTCVLLDGNLLWQPHFTPPSTVQQPITDAIRIFIYEAPKRLLFGNCVRLCIVHPREVTISFIRSGGQPIDFVQHDTERTITEPITIRPSSFSREANCKIELTLGVKNGTRVIPMRYAVDVHITGAAILTQDGWTALDGESPLTVEQARMQPIIIFLMDIEKWVLLEGDTLVGPLWKNPHCIGALTGLGAPLAIQEGRYNVLNKPLVLAREIVDYGCISEIAVDTIDAPVRTLSVHLSHSIEPDEHYSIVWWDESGSFRTFAPECSEVQGHDMWWLSSIPQDLSQPLVIAIAYDGVRLGTWWSANWSYILRETPFQDPMAAAAMLRWFQLPLLSNRFRCDVEQFAYTYPCDVIAAWVGEVEFPQNLQSPESSIGWLSAVRNIFWRWEPSIGMAQAIIPHLAAVGVPVHEQLLSVVWQLLRFSPLLMGKVIQRWVEDVGIPQVGTHMAQTLVRILLYGVAGAETSEALRQEKMTLQGQVAATMGVDSAFIEKELMQQAFVVFQGRPVSPIHENNIAMAINETEPFRQLLSIRILELIDQTLSSRR